MGAGASKGFGYPLTADILPAIREQLGTGRLFGKSNGDMAAENQLQSYIRRMLPGWEQRSIGTPPITDVLSLLDYSSISQTSPLLGGSTTELLQFRRLLERAIYEVINDAFFEGDTEQELDRFVRYLHGLSDPGVITTNYDIEVETALFRKPTYKEIETGFDFGFDWREPSADTEKLYPRPAQPMFRYYKLHGSLNWLRCDVCEHTYINVDGPISGLAFEDRRIPENTCHCGHSPLSLVLTAPSLVRDVRNTDLLSTWQAALEWLRSAAEWIIIGYSFPQEDLSIRSMFIRAYQARGRKDPPRVTVVQKNATQEMKDRYKILFPDCEWIDTGLTGFLDMQEKE
jgi:hypothetical protein